MRRNGKPSRDIYQEVTDRIVAALEDGVAPWVRPWRSLGADGELRNAVSGRPYHGVNVLLLNLESTFPQELAMPVKDGDEIHIAVMLAGG